MQGWGNFVNTCVILIFLSAFDQTSTNTKKLDPFKLDLTWRLSFVVGLVPITFMLVYRLFFLRESNVFIRHEKDSSVRPGPPGPPCRLDSVKRYWCLPVVPQSAFRGSLSLCFVPPRVFLLYWNQFFALSPQQAFTLFP